MRNKMFFLGCLNGLIFRLISLTSEYMGTYRCSISYFRRPKISKSRIKLDGSKKIFSPGL